MALTMRGMPFQTEAGLLSLQLTSVKAVCNIATMRTIFPGAVFGNAKRLSAMAADDLVVTTVLDQFRVGIPPLSSASIGAENSAFPSRRLHQSHSAALTRIFCAARLVYSRTAQGIPFAVSFHRIYGQSHKLSDFLIAVSLCT